MSIKTGKITRVSPYQEDFYWIDYRLDSAPEDDPYEGNGSLFLNKKNLLSEAFLASAEGRKITIEKDQRKVKQVTIDSTIVFKKLKGSKTFN